jgi:hypothetical protein
VVRRSANAIDLRAEHFDADAIPDIAFAGSAFAAALHDVHFHHVGDQSAWDCYGSNPLEEIARLRDAIAEVEEGIREARRRLAVVERPARLRAVREARRGT